jgi:AraC-like DNA-binding protein
MDQLRSLPLDEGSKLPIPQDARLARIAVALLENPSDPRRLEDWARFAAVSSRTLLRLFQAETGMSFEAWRTQMRVASAIAWLTEGRRVSDVAYDLGYETPSAFIAMFRRQTGFSPRKYLMR